MIVSLFISVQKYVVYFFSGFFFRSPPICQWSWRKFALYVSESVCF